MEFLTMSFINTSTAVSVTTGSTSSASLYDRKNTTYFTSVGDNSDLTTTTLRFEFTSEQNIDRLAIENHNLKSFRIYYNSNTANLFTLNDALTVSSEWASNSETSQYFRCDTVACSIITIEATATMIANAEKRISQFWACTKLHVFTTDPGSSGYDPELDRKEYRHEMSDGGSALYVVQDNFKCRIKRRYVDTSEYSDLLSMYQRNDSLVFVPEPTGTSWNDQIWAVNWVGKFDCMGYSDNYKGSGYNLTMNLEEIAK